MKKSRTRSGRGGTPSVKSPMTPKKGIGNNRTNRKQSIANGKDDGDNKPDPTTAVQGRP